VSKASEWVKANAARPGTVIGDLTLTVMATGGVSLSQVRGIPVYQGSMSGPVGSPAQMQAQMMNSMVHAVEIRPDDIAPLVQFLIATFGEPAQVSEGERDYQRELNRAVATEPGIMGRLRGGNG
jgi:hypothetical protein